MAAASAHHNSGEGRDTGRASRIPVVDLWPLVAPVYTPPQAPEEPMDLSLSEEYQALQAEIRAFIATHGHKSPKVGGGRRRPDQKTLDWQKLLVEHGYAGRTIPRDYGGYGAKPDVMAAAVIAEEFARANVYAG